MNLTSQQTIGLQFNNFHQQLQLYYEGTNNTIKNKIIKKKKKTLMR